MLLLLVASIVRWCKRIKDPIAVTVTSGGESVSLTVGREQADALVAAGKVYYREHETDANGEGIDDGDEESGADKLEVAALLCVLGNYVVAALCHLANDGTADADRSSALDVVFFLAAVGFTVAPFFFAFKFRKEEKVFMHSIEGVHPDANAEADEDAHSQDARP